ncbi:MAG: hypothetical protein JWN94_1068 [Betaproteobacteria bacterium]|nr:hypothetical protein [Betaproteobacteria bacterium]
MTGEFRQHIAHPCAWKAAELQADSAWIYELSQNEIAEIETALKTVKEAGVPLLKIRTRDFPLAATAQRMREVSRQLEEGRGIALVRGVPVARYDNEDLERIYWGLSVHLGVVIAQNTRGDHIGHVRDEGLKWGQVSGGELVRGYRTNAYMPFHSDPTDRVGLFCVQKAKAGGLSSIASSTAVYNEILAQQPQALDCLFRGFHYSLRGEATGGIAQITEYRVPLFDYFEGRLSSRYVRKTIEQAAAIGGAPLSDEEKSALDLLDALVKSDELRFDMSFEPGDIQYLNNHVSFHSRTGFEDDPDPKKRRHLMRVWLQSADARPLSPVMSRPHGMKSPFLSREQALQRDAVDA